MTDPVPLMWLLLGVVLLISALGYRKGRIFKGLDVLILTVYGAVGALVFFLWFITDHNGTVNNLNILWAWPVHIPAISLLWFKNTRKWYWQAYGAVLFITLLAFPLLPQALHAAVVPLILIGIIRAFVNIKIT